MLRIKKLTDKLRAQTVKRWTIVHTTKGQSLAEHSFNVAAIAEKICRLSGISPVNVIPASLVHDLDEILTGDIPSPFKRHAESRNMVLNDLCSDRLDHLTEDEKIILKAADVIENTWFIREFGSGSHARQVAKDQMDFLKYDFMRKQVRGGLIGQAVQEVMDEIFETKYESWPGE